MTGRIIHQLFLVILNSAFMAKERMQSFIPFSDVFCWLDFFSIFNHISLDIRKTDFTSIIYQKYTEICIDIFLHIKKLTENFLIIIITVTTTTATIAINKLNI